MDLRNSELEAKIENTKKKIASLREKRADIDAKIRKEEAELNHLTMMDQSAQFDVLKAAAEQSGYSMSDLLALLMGTTEEAEYAEEEDEAEEEAEHAEEEAEYAEEAEYEENDEGSEPIYEEAEDQTDSRFGFRF